MTYENAIEFNFDLNKNNLKSTKDMIEGKDYFKFNLSTLPKMESITYTNSDFSVLYTSEANGFSDIAIMQQDCNHRIQ